MEGGGGDRFPDTKKHKWQPNDVNHGNLCGYFFVCFFWKRAALVSFFVKEVFRVFWNFWSSCLWLGDARSSYCFIESPGLPR